MDQSLKTYYYQEYILELNIHADTYINFTVRSKSNFTKYNSKISNDDLIDNIDIQKLIKIINNCFDLEGKYKPKQNYSLDIYIDKNFIKLIFTIDFDKIYQLVQEIKIKEVQYSSQSLTANKINQLENRIDELENKNILLGIDDFGKFFHQKINITTIDYNEWLTHKIVQPAYILNEFKLVNKIIVDINKLTWHTSGGTLDTKRIKGGYIDPWHNGGSNVYSHTLSAFLSDTVKGYTSGNIFNDCMVWMPNVTTLEFVNNFNLNPLMFRSLPNINHIHLNNTTTTNPNIECNLLDFIKKHTNIKFIEFTKCNNIQQYDNIKSYSDSNGIKIKINN